MPDWSGSGKPALPWLIHGFSTRIAGKTTVYQSRASDLNLGFTASDDPKIVATNRKLFVGAVTEDKAILGMVTLRQIHSSLIHRVGARDVHGAG